MIKQYCQSSSSVDRRRNRCRGRRIRACQPNISPQSLVNAKGAKGMNEYRKGRYFLACGKFLFFKAETLNFVEVRSHLSRIDLPLIPIQASKSLRINTLYVAIPIIS